MVKNLHIGNGLCQSHCVYVAHTCHFVWLRVVWGTAECTHIGEGTRTRKMFPLYTRNNPSSINSSCAWAYRRKSVGRGKKGDLWINTTREREKKRAERQANTQLKNFKTTNQITLFDSVWYCHFSEQEKDGKKSLRLFLLSKHIPVKYCDGF